MIPALEAKGLTKHFGDHPVLQEVTLSVEPGERVAVLGLNGVGKTTLFRCVLGLCTFEGKLHVDGQPAGPAGKQARQRVGYLPQQPPRFDLRLVEFLETFAALRRVPPDQAFDWLTELGLDLELHGDKRLSELSGGMLQKALLAMALGAQASLLLLDEPTANLDAASRGEFLRAIGRVSETTTLLFASHRLDDVESLAGRLLVLHGGRFVFDGSVQQMLEVAGAEVGLRLHVPAGERTAVARELASCAGVLEVRANGVGIDLEVERGRRAEVLFEAQRRGVPLLDFRTRPPGLEEIMGNLVARHERRGGSEQGGSTAGEVR